MRMPREGVYSVALAMLLAVIFSSMAQCGSLYTVRRVVALESGALRAAAQPVFGWGGYISSIEQVEPILDDLELGGYTGLRYWAVPSWYAKSPGHNLNLTILDALVDGAAARNIVVYIDCEHNYPPSAYLDGHEKQWIADLTMVGTRYKDKTNVVLECVNEYTGSGQPAKYNRAISALRKAGVHLPLLFNFGWNQVNVALKDPDNNYAIGRHFYGTSLDNYNPQTPVSLATVVDAAGIDDMMYKYFYSPTEKYYLQSALKLRIPNGFVVTEMGPTSTESLVGNPSVGSLAYAMQFLREGVNNKVTVLCYRVGDYSKKETYEKKALQYFGEPFFPGG